MLLRISLFAFLTLAVVADRAPLQTASTDRLVLAINSQCLNAAGGAQALSPVRVFTATGTITYFWAWEQVQGSATVPERRSDYFRLDANIPDGTRSYA